MKDIVTENMQKRFRFLEYLYLSSKGMPKRFIPVSPFLSQVTTSKEEADYLKTDLYNRKLIYSMDGGASFAITDTGIDEVERVYREPNHPTANFPANALHIYGNQNVVQQDTQNSTQIVSYTESQIKALTELVAELKRRLPEVGLEPKDQVDVDAEVKTVEAQLSRSNTRWSTVKDSLVSLRDMLIGFMRSDGGKTVLTVAEKAIAGELAQKIESFTH